jgi:glutamate synthase domain-containing protein 3
MRGGEAFIYDEECRFEKLFNDVLVEIVRLPEGGPSAAKLRGLIEAHVDATGSGKGRAILDNWSTSLAKFWRVKPQGGLAETVEAKAGEMVAKG